MGDEPLTPAELALLASITSEQHDLLMAMNEDGATDNAELSARLEWPMDRVVRVLCECVEKDLVSPMPDNDNGN